MLKKVVTMSDCMPCGSHRSLDPENWISDWAPFFSNFLWIRESTTLSPRPRCVSDQADQLFIDHLYTAFTRSQNLLDLTRLVIEESMDIYSPQKPDAETSAKLLPLFPGSENNLHNDGTGTLSGDLVAAEPVVGTNAAHSVNERLLLLEKDVFSSNMCLALRLGETRG